MYTLAELSECAEELSKREKRKRSEILPFFSESESRSRVQVWKRVEGRKCLAERLREFWEKFFLGSRSFFEFFDERIKLRFLNFCLKNKFIN